MAKKRPVNTQAAPSWGGALYNSQPDANPSSGVTSFAGGDGKNDVGLVAGYDQNEVRASNQTVGEKLRNGAVKMGGTALTSFLEPFVDLTVGVLSAGTTAATGGDVGAAVRSSYDNAATQKLDSFNEYLAEQFPNYYSEAEKQKSLLGQLGTANFWADKVGNGVGFMLGAIASGAVTGGAADAIKAGRIAKGVATAAELAAGVTEATAEGGAILSAVGKAAASATKRNAANNLFTGMVGALGESGMEARQIAKDTGIAVRKQLLADKGVDPALYEDYTFSPAEEKHIADLEEAAGNSGLAYNLALVGGTNALLLPKIFRKGYQAERVALSAVEKTEEGLYRAAAMSGRKKALLATKNVLLNNLEEATQEELQYALEKALPDYYTKQRDPGAKADLQEYMASIGEGLQDAFGSKEGLENGLLGAIIGFAGAKGSVQEVGAKQTTTEAAVAAVNNAIQGKGQQALFKAMVAANAYAKDGDAATIAGDQKKAQDAAHGGFASLVRGYSQAGKFEDLLASLDEQGKLTPEEFKAQNGFSEDADLGESVPSLVAKQKEKAKAIQKLSNDIEAAYPGDGMSAARDMFFGLATQMQDNAGRETKLANELTKATGISLDAFKLSDKDSAWENYRTAIKAWAEEPGRNPLEVNSVLDKAADVAELANERIQLAQNYRLLEDPAHRETVMKQHQLDLDTQAAQEEEDKAAEAEAAAQPAVAATPAAPAGMPTVTPVAPLSVVDQPEGKGIVVANAEGKFRMAVFDASGKLLHWVATDENGERKGANNMAADRFPELEEKAKAGLAYSAQAAPSPTPSPAPTVQPSPVPTLGAQPAAAPSAAKSILLGGVKAAASAPAGPTDAQKAVVAKLEGLKQKAPKLTEDESTYANEEDTYGRASGMKKKLLDGQQQVPSDESFLKNNPQFADRGNIVDLIVRQYFLDGGATSLQAMKDVASVYAETIKKNKRRVADGTSNIWEKMEVKDSFYTELLQNLDTIKGMLDKQGWVVLSDVPTLHGVIDGEKLAGTMDLVAVNKDGGTYIIDLKTQEKSRRADYLLADVGKGTLKTKANGEQYVADESKYREGDLIQQSVYAELLKQRTGIDVLGRLIFPMVTDGGKAKTSKAIYDHVVLEDSKNAAGSTIYSINLSTQKSVGGDTELGKLDINGLISHYLGRAPLTAPVAKVDKPVVPTGPTSILDTLQGDAYQDLRQSFAPFIADNANGAARSAAATAAESAIGSADPIRAAAAQKVQALLASTDKGLSMPGLGDPEPSATGLQPGTSYPSDYYAQTAFKGADMDPKEVGRRQYYQDNLANPQHPQHTTPVYVQRIKSGAITYYNLVTDVVSDVEGEVGAVVFPAVKVGYLANTSSYQKGKVESPEAKAARESQAQLKKDVDAYFAANPEATTVPLLYTKSAAFAANPSGKSLSELDNRFTLHGKLRVFTQRTDAFSGQLLPSAITGPSMTSEEKTAIAALRNTGKAGALTDGYVLAVTAPDGVGVRYIAAKTKSVAASELQDIFGKAAANIENLDEYFFVADQPNTFLRYTNGSWEVQRNAENGSGQAVLLGYLRLKKGAIIRSLADFKANTVFFPAPGQERDEDHAAVGEPGGTYLRDIRYQVPAKATEEQLKAILIPTTGDSLYNTVSIQPLGLGEEVPEVSLPSLNEEEQKALTAAVLVAPDAETKASKPRSARRKSSDSIAQEEVKDVGAMKLAMDGMLASEPAAVAMAQFKEVVGENFEALGLERLPSNVYRSGQTMGVFLGKAAYFAAQVVPGTGYHEAGHAVFRGMLTPKQRSELYRVAGTRLGASNSELAAFRNSSTAYESMDERDLYRLLLEEKIMDGYMAYKAGKPAGFFGKVFRYLSDALAALLGKRDAISTFYRDMDRGAFRSAREVTTSSEPAAYKNIPFTTVEQSKRMVGLLTVRYMRTVGAAIENGITREAHLRELINQRFLEDTIPFTEEYDDEDLLDKLNLYLPDLAEPGVDEDSIYRKAYKDPRAVSVLVEQVLKQAKVLDFTPTLNEEGDAEDDAEVQSVDGQEIKESFTKGGYLEAKAMANVSQEIRMLLSLTTYVDSNGLEQVVDFDQTASILERILENKRTFDAMFTAIGERVKLGENVQLNAVYKELVARIAGPDGELYKRKFQQGLYRILLTPVQFTFGDDGQSKAFNADSTNSVEKVRVGQWADRWARTMGSHAQAQADFAAIDDALFTNENATSHEGLLYGATAIAQGAAKLGMDISKTFVYDVLAGKSEEYVWRKEKDSEDKRRSLASDLGQLARYQDGGTNPFLTELDESGRRADAETRALGLAKADAGYQDTILNPSYRNAENKSQYAYTQASYLLEKSRDLQDGKLVMDELTAVNPLLHGSLAVDVKSLQLEYLAGVRRDDDVVGQSYGNMDAKVYLLMGHLAYRGSTGTAVATPYRRVIYGQLEAKSTAFTFQVPKQAVGTFSKDGVPTAVTTAALAQFRQYQEKQIARTWAEIDAITVSGDLTKAVKNVHFTKYKNGKPVLPTRETAAKDLPRGLKFLVTPGLTESNGQEYATQLQEELLRVHVGQLTEAGFDVKDKKVQALLGYGHTAASFEDYLREYLLHDFIYRESYSQLTRGNEAWFKDAVDITKRGGGLIAAGPSFGEGEYPMYPLQTDAFHIYTENMQPVSEEDQALLDSGEASDELKSATAQVDATDAQGYCTAKRFAFLQKREAKLDKSVLAKLEKFATEGGKASGGWTGISMKNVYYGEEPSNGATYLKMSVFPLFPEVTSFQTKEGNWVAKPGFEQLHNLRVRMEEQETDNESSFGEAYHDTAIKAGLRSLNFREGSGEYGSLAPVTLQNKSLRRQVSNPSGKEKVIDPTQLLQILDSGMEDKDEFTYTTSSGEDYEVSVGELRASFQGLLSEMKLEANTKYADFQKLVVDGQSLGKRAILAGLEASMADENTLAFFGQTANGEWALSPDMPVIQQKAQQLVLAGFNKSVFSQKVSGTKRSLVSSAMTKVVVGTDGLLAHDWSKPYGEQSYMNGDGSLKEGYTARRLAMHSVVDGKVNPAEIIVSEELLAKKGITLAQLYGPATSEATRNAILEEIGLRIPSQDKHSIIPCKIVGWLPAYMGSVVMAPAQITYLSGADYDIDSLFSLQRAYYLHEDGGVRLYGDAEKDTSETGNGAYTRWEEYQTYQRDKHPAYSALVNERLAKDVHYGVKALVLQKAKAALREWRDANKGTLSNLKEEISTWQAMLVDTNPDNESYKKLAPKELKAAKNALKKLKDAGLPLQENTAEILDAVAIERERVEAGVRKDLGMPAYYEDFKKLPLYKQTNGYARMNKLMDVRAGLALNPHDYPAARSPVELDSLKADAKVISKATGAGLDLPLPYNSTPVIAQHHIDNGVGLANVGVAAKANNSGVFLTKIGYKLPIAMSFGNRWLTGYADKSEHDLVLGSDMDGKPSIIGKEDRRKQDTSSAHISSATDNAKEKLAALLNLSMPMLGVAMNLVHMSVGRTRSLVFVNQPILRLLAQRKMAAGSIIPGFEDSMEVTKNMIGELQAWLGTVEAKDTIKQEKKEYNLAQLLEKAVKEEQYELATQLQERIANTAPEDMAAIVHTETGEHLSDEVLVAALSERLPDYVKARDNNGKAYLFHKMDPNLQELVQQQLGVLMKYSELEDFTTSWFGPVGRLLGLNKGVGSTFADMRKFREAGDKITPYTFTNQKPNKPDVSKPGTKPFIYLSLREVQDEKALDANLISLKSTTKEVSGNHILATEVVEDFTDKHRSYGLRKDAVDGFQNGILAHLAVTGYQELSGVRLADYQYLLTSEKENIVAQWQKVLEQHPDLETNPFVYNTQNRKPDAKGGVPYYRRVFNTRADFSPQVMESITDGVSAMLTDKRPEVRELMRLTYLYEGVKNNFQYKNESLIKLFPAVVHGKQAEALRKDLEALVAGNTYYTTFMSFGRNWYSVPDNRKTLKPFGRSVEVEGEYGSEQQWVLGQYAKQDKGVLHIDLTEAMKNDMEVARLGANGVGFDEQGNIIFPDFFSTTEDVQVSQYEMQTTKVVWMRRRPLRFVEKTKEAQSLIEKRILAGENMPKGVEEGLDEATYEMVPENRSTWYQATYHLSAQELAAFKEKAKVVAAPVAPVDDNVDVPQDPAQLEAPDAVDLDMQNYLSQQEDVAPPTAAKSLLLSKKKTQPAAWKDDAGLPGGDAGSALYEALAAEAQMTPYVKDLLDNWERKMQKSLHNLSLSEKIALASDLESGKASTSCFI